LMTGENLIAMNTNSTSRIRNTMMATKFPNTALTEIANISEKPVKATQPQSGGVNFSRNSNWFMS